MKRLGLLLSVVWCACPPPPAPVDARVEDAGVDAGRIIRDYDFPQEIDFGAVLLGTSAQQTLSVANFEPVTRAYNVSNVFGFERAAFQVSPVGRLVLGPGEKKTLTFEFTPNSASDHQASVQLTPEFEGAPEFTLRLRGRGVSQLLVVAPSTLDFGTTVPGHQVLGSVTLQNLGRTPVKLGTPSVTLADFQVLSGASEIPPLSSVTVSLGFRPASAVVRNGTLRIPTDLPSQPVVTAALTGSGGGPKLSAQPAALSFGTVAIFSPAPAKPVTRTRTVRLSNVAPKATNPALHLTVKTASVVPPGEFQVAVPPAIEGGSFVDLEVTFTPQQAAGARNAELVLDTNDVSQPQTRIPLTAQVVAATPCVYAVAPQSLDFGRVMPGATRELTVTVTNGSTTASDTCFVGQVRATGDGAFRAETAGDFALAPGESRELKVRFFSSAPTPAASAMVSGKLAIEISSSAQPLAELPLAASMGSACLTLSPPVVDFGVVKSGCGAPARAVSVVNTCELGTVVVNSATLAGAAAITATGTANLSNRALAPGAAASTVQLSYQPGAAPLSDATLTVDVTEPTGPAVYVLPIRGRTSASGANADVFTLPAQTVSDVVVIVDDANATIDLLAQNPDAFFKPAELGNVDLHAGIIWSEGASEDGGFFRSVGGHPKVLSRQTPQLAQAWASNLSGAANSSPTEQLFSAAATALTSSKVNLDNAGFLRAGSLVRVASFGQSEDQSPLPVAHYVARLSAMRKPGQFSFSALGPMSPPTTGCFYDGTEGPRLPAMISATGGAGENFCPLAQQLAAIERIGAHASSGQRHFSLTAPPESPQQVAVELNGATVTSGFTFDAMTSTLSFPENLGPPPGARLIVRYPQVCLP